MGLRKRCPRDCMVDHFGAQPPSFFSFPLPIIRHLAPLQVFRGRLKLVRSGSYCGSS